MNQTNPLTQLGDAIERAARAELSTAARRRRRRFATAGLSLAVLVPGVAFAAGSLLDGPTVAASMPAGTLALAGTIPTCTVVEQNVEFHCTLEHAPAPEVQDWKDTVESTVDASHHINGGCRSLVSSGLVWQCYLGTAAVDQQIIGADLLGQVSTGPSVG